MEENNLQKTYNYWSKTYDKTPNPIISAEEITMHSLLRSIEFHDVLDAATGTGRYAVYFSKQGKKVSAIDCNKNMLSELKRKCKKLQLPIEIRQEDVSELSFGDMSFDLVICTLALAHVENLIKPCQEFIRVLRPGGHLIISDLHPIIQEEMGPCFKGKVTNDLAPVFFPNYHSKVEDYLEALKLAKANISATLDIPVKLQDEPFPGVLIIWARKPEF